MKNTITIILISLFAGLLSTGCEHPLLGMKDVIGNGGGLITVTINGGTASRWGANNLEPSEFTHEITVSNKEARYRGTITGIKGTVQFSVKPGLWTISVEALLNGKVVAVGVEPDVQINKGYNETIYIQMKEVGDDVREFTVSNEAEWKAALSAISNGSNGRSYAINLIGDFYAEGAAGAATFGGVTGLNVSITGNHAISLRGTGSLLYIKADQTVNLKEASLIGNKANNQALVRVVEGGTFNMESGTISGNFNTISIDGYPVNAGGGVCNQNGTFKMSGGTISGNTVYGSGGGVFTIGGKFEMTGGTISGNNAHEIGGGVQIGYAGNFVMSGGTIGPDNNATEGGGVHVGGGTFAMSGSATISGNTAHGSGGGVFITAGGINTDDGVITTPGLFEMTGGTIGPDNTAKFGGGVAVGNGEFNMSGTAVILGNKATGGDGGGVYVWDKGTFNMTGGTISGNTATGEVSSGGVGGGVYVGPEGTFNMTGGTISGNTAIADSSDTVGVSYGGGVYVGDKGIFRIETGTIYGLDDTINANIARSGTALYIQTGPEAGIAQRGTFSVPGDPTSEWDGKEYLENSDTTIKVENGKIDP